MSLISRALLISIISHQRITNVLHVVYSGINLCMRLLVLLHCSYMYNGHVMNEW